MQPRPVKSPGLGSSAEVQDLLDASARVPAEEPGHGQDPGLGEHEPQRQRVGPVEGAALPVVRAARIPVCGEEGEEEDGGVEEDDDEAGQADVERGVHSLPGHVQSQVLALDQVHHCHL